MKLENKNVNKIYFQSMRLTITNYIHIFCWLCRQMCIRAEDLLCLIDILSVLCCKISFNFLFLILQTKIFHISFYFPFFEYPKSHITKIHSTCMYFIHYVLENLKWHAKKLYFICEKWAINFLKHFILLN